MNIIHKCMHHIDFEDANILEVPIIGDEAIEFINKVIDETTANENTRSYERRSDTTEVIGFINSMVHADLCSDNDVELSDSEVAVAIDINAVTTRIATRLMESEIIAQESISATGNRLNKGSLIQAFIKDKDYKYKYVLMKIDHSAYLDRDSLIKRVGLPLEEKILKSCVIEYDESHTIENISLYDSTKKMAQYWYHGLLELNPTNTDEINTKKSIQRIMKNIDNVVGKESEPDSILIKNKSKGYFNSNSEFDLDEFLLKVVDEYQPKSESVNKEKLKQKISMAAERGFDSQFVIIPDVLTKYKADIFKIDERIALTLYDEIDNLTDKIIVENEDGKYNLKLMDIPKDMYDKFNF